MKLYTGQGDEGDTSGPGGRRIAKSDAFCEAVGTLDELGAAVGLCLRAADDECQAPVREVLAPLAGELLAAGAMLHAAPRPAAGGGLDPAALARMESRIDAACEKLPELKGFILPAGCELACRLHAARTICRRAERRVAAWCGDEAPPLPDVLRYLNRLGDLLFAMARLANLIAGVPETTWSP